MSYVNVILENSKAIVKKIVTTLKDYVNGLLFRKAPKIQIDIRKLVEDAIRRQPEYKSLLGGELQSELGVPHTKPRLDQIVRIIVDSIEVKVKKLKNVGDIIEGGLEIDFVKSNFKDLTELPVASYVTDKGVKIEWLRWLLLEGDKIIVRSYTIGIDPKDYARTGLGEIMIPSYKKAGGWRVPPEFSGTAEDNFITRALIEVSHEINRLMERSLSGN